MYPVGDIKKRALLRPLRSGESVLFKETAGLNIERPGVLGGSVTARARGK